MARQRHPNTTTLDPAERYVALYARISRDKRKQQEGVQDQLTLGRAYAERLWPAWPVREFCDPSVSAGDDGAYRPEWEALQDEIVLGRVHALVAGEQSRFIRGVERWAKWLTTLELNAVTSAHSYRTGQLWASGGDRATSQIKSVLDEDELRRTRARTKERNDQRAQRGVPHLGKPVYGYQVGTIDDERTLVQHPDEADVVRRVADRVLAGWSLTAIVAELIKLDTPTRMGGQWRTNNLRKMLRSPTLAGLRLRDDVEHRGRWKPILDERTWREVNARLDQRGRKLGRPVTRHLLSRIARCGCGGPMYGIRRDIRRRGQPLTERIYRCSNLTGCGRVSIDEALLDDHVLAELTGLCDSPEIARQLGDEDDVHAPEREALNAQLTQLAEQRSAARRRAADPGVRFDLDDFEEYADELDAHVAAVSDQLRALPVVRHVDIDELLVMLRDEDVRIQREAIALFVDHVLVEPANGRRGIERVTLHPRKI